MRPSTEFPRDTAVPILRAVHTILLVTVPCDLLIAAQPHYPGGVAATTPLLILTGVGGLLGLTRPYFVQAMVALTTHGANATRPRRSALLMVALILAGTVAEIVMRLPFREVNALLSTALIIGVVIIRGYHAIWKQFVGTAEALQDPAVRHGRIRHAILLFTLLSMGMARLFSILGALASSATDGGWVATLPFSLGAALLLVGQTPSEGWFRLGCARCRIPGWESPPGTPYCPGCLRGERVAPHPFRRRHHGPDRGPIRPSPAERRPDTPGETGDREDKSYRS